jgi:CheY-like chemotaxis protein
MIKIINKFTSSLLVAEKLISKKNRKTIATFTPDWRDRFSKIADNLKTDEISLMAEVARRLKLPFIGEVNSLDIAELEGAELAVGATSIKNSGEIVGVVCIDPLKAQALFPALAWNRVFLTSWSLLKEKQSSAIINKKEETNSRALLVLEAILQQVQENQADYIIVLFKEGVCKYSYNVSPEKRAVGTIVNDVAEEFLAYLEKVVNDHDGNCFDFPLSVKRNVEGYFLELKKSFSLERELWFIEDDPSFKRAVEIFLQGKKIEVKGFKNAEDTLEHLKNTRTLPKVVVTDQHLSAKSGIWLIGEAKRDPNLSFIEFILLTSDYTTDIRVEALKVGAYACLNKQDDPAILLAYLHKFLS